MENEHDGKKSSPRAGRNVSGPLLALLEEMEEMEERTNSSAIVR